MYKLLLVTNRPEVVSAFDSIQDWEGLGFRMVRKASSPEDAIAHLKAHHSDAIALALPPEEEHRLITFLNERYPLRPIMRATANPEEICAYARETEQLLTRTRADYSNDRYDEAEMMAIIRHNYFRRMLSGAERDPQRIRRGLLLVRSKMDPDQPCVAVRLSVPDDDGYIASHWKHGAEGLEVAMRNIFGAELNGMRILTSILPDEHIYTVACPLLGTEPRDPDEMLEEVTSHVSGNLSHIYEYLNIDMRIDAVCVLPSILELPTLQDGETATA
ncbi:MAG: hypothetical protein IKP40_02080 [Clostridia bacterium]|nr:hypothetical protein [Clostridia bacterium]